MNMPKHILVLIVGCLAFMGCVEDKTEALPGSPAPVQMDINPAMDDTRPPMQNDGARRTERWNRSVLAQIWSGARSCMVCTVGFATGIRSGYPLTMQTPLITHIFKRRRPMSS